MKTQKQIAVVVFCVSALFVVLGIKANSALLAMPGIIGSFIGIILITLAFYEPTNHSRSYLLESGRTGLGVVFGIIFIICGLFSGSTFGLLIFGAFAFASLHDYFKK